MGRESQRTRALLAALAALAVACGRAPREAPRRPREAPLVHVETDSPSRAAPDSDPDPDPRAQPAPRAPVASIGGAAVVDGALTPDQIRQVVQRRFGDVERCYREALSRRPRTQGRLSIHFVVSGSGHVESLADDYNSTSDRELGVCASAAVRRWVFPRSRDDAPSDVRFPFAFDSGY